MTSYSPKYSPFAALRHKTPYKKRHVPSTGPREKFVGGDELSKLIGLETIDDLRKKRMAEELSALSEVRINPANLDGNVFSLPDPRIKEEKFAKKREELARRRELNGLIKKWSEPQMTVSLYKSTANGTNEIVVQTNAQSLDVFIAGLSSALHDALVKDATNTTGRDNTESIIAATLKNAFPVAFAISGYKAEKVSESKLLTCGFASPDSSELLAQSAA